jgi:hypothetical protein
MKVSKLLFRIFLAGIFCFVFSDRANAQWWQGAVTYQVSFPTGDTKDFTDGTSFRGVGLDFRTPLDENTTWGLFAGWNVFHKRITTSIDVQFQDVPGVVTGLQDRTLNAFPIMLNIHRYFGQTNGIRPYVGLNAGGFINLQRFEIGILSLDENRWDWGGAPEVGVLIPLQNELTLLISGKFNYAFTGKSVIGTDINNSYFNINIGFAWKE